MGAAQALTGRPSPSAIVISLCLPIIAESIDAARSDTGAVIRNGRVTCRGRAGNARLRATTARVQGGQVTCTWLIPANARGRTFRGSATVVFEGLRASRSISARIR